MANEFRVQIENGNGTALTVLFQTTTIARANEFRNAMQELNDRFALDHIIATREIEYNSNTGEWSIVEEFDHDHSYNCETCADRNTLYDMR